MRVPHRSQRSRFALEFNFPPSYPAWPAYKEEGEGKLNSSEKRDCWDLGGNTCKDAIVFFIPSSQL